MRTGRLLLEMDPRWQKGLLWSVLPQPVFFVHEYQEACRSRMSQVLDQTYEFMDPRQAGMESIKSTSLNVLHVAVSELDSRGGVNIMASYFSEVGTAFVKSF